MNIVYDSFAEFNDNTKGFEPALAKKWTVNGDMMTVSLRKQTWHNGDQVTANDVVVQYRLAKYEGDLVWNYLDAVTAKDDSTVQFKLIGELNPTVIKRYILPTRVHAPAYVFKEYLNKIENASEGDERDKAIANLLNYAREKPTGNGPYKVDKTTNSKFELSVYKDHPWADDISVKNYEFKYASGNQDRWASLSSGNIDGYGSTYVPPDVYKSLPDSIREVNFTQYADFALVFNHDDEDFGKRKVRQALAHIIDRKTVANNVGPRTRKPIKVPTGTSPFATKKYLPSSVVDSLNKYETNEEKATKLLQEAGYSKEGNKWVRGDGKPLKAPIKVDSGLSDYVSGVQTIVPQLKSFGIQAELKTIEGVSLSKQIRNSDFRLQGDSWGEWNESYPFFDYRSAFVSQDMVEWRNLPDQVTVPWPPENPNGEKKVKPSKMVIELSETTSKEKQQKLLGQLAWIYNITLPKLQMSERMDQAWINEKDWDVPSNDEDVMGVRFPAFWAVKTGAISPK
ncbi:hypothetical protein A4G99_16650 [Haladaptatus sp. R4]|nr:hypothetical protein A4G99_16650 [Haladaptatus sp. R4]